MSTSGGTRGATQLVRQTLNASELSTVGSQQVTLPVVNPGGQLLVPVDYVAQFQYVDSTFDFSAAHLNLLDSSGAPLLDPLQQAFAVDTVSAMAVNTTARAIPQMVGGGFKLGTAGNTDPVIAGPILALAIQAAGTGYAIGDTGHVNGGNNDATYHVTHIGLLGAVTAIGLDTRGSNYDTLNNPRGTTNGGAQPGVGVGLTVNITNITIGQSSLQVAVAYLMFPAI